MVGYGFLAILILGEMLLPAYRKLGLVAKNLSRTTEDSGTVVTPLVPWSVGGVFKAGTLGVETTKYAPWAIMCYASSILAVIYGYTEFAIAKRQREDENLPDS